MSKLVFENVGRGKWNGEIDIQDNLSPDDTASCAYCEAKKHLASRYPDTEYNATTNEGIITAGFRTVGIFYVVSSPTQQGVKGNTATDPEIGNE